MAVASATTTPAPRRRSRRRRGDAAPAGASAPSPCTPSADRAPTTSARARPAAARARARRRRSFAERALQLTAGHEPLELARAADQRALDEHHRKGRPAGPHLQRVAAAPLAEVAAELEVVVGDAGARRAACAPAARTGCRPCRRRAPGSTTPPPARCGRCRRCRLATVSRIAGCRRASSRIGAGHGRACRIDGARTLPPPRAASRRVRRARLRSRARRAGSPATALLQLGGRVHHERAVLRDRLAERPAGDEQHARRLRLRRPAPQKRTPSLPASLARIAMRSGSTAAAPAPPITTGVAAEDVDERVVPGRQLGVEGGCPAAASGRGRPARSSAASPRPPCRGSRRR